MSNQPPLPARAAAPAGAAPAPAADPSSVVPLPPVPPRIDEGGSYDACLDMVENDPTGALAFAEGWAARGGGNGAAHCRALALIGLGDPDQAAGVLDGIARDEKDPIAARAAIAGQASQAWLMANRPQAALASAALALALYGDDPDLLLGHAQAAIRMRDYPTAIGDLDRALALDPDRPDMLSLRASARRGSGDLAGARADAAQALALDPGLPDALLERGVLRQMGGDLDGARADFQKAIDLAPDGPTADLAQQDLSLLDAGPDTR